MMLICANENTVRVLVKHIVKELAQRIDKGMWNIDEAAYTIGVNLAYHLQSESVIRDIAFKEIAALGVKDNKKGVTINQVEKVLADLGLI